MDSKCLKIISFVTVCFFAWTLGGVGGLANAAKAAHERNRKNYQHSKKTLSAERRLEKTFDQIEEILANKKLPLQQKREALKVKRKEVDELDDNIRQSFSDTEAHLKKAKLPQKILQRHYDFVKQYEEYLEVVHHDLDSLESKPGFFRALGKKIDKQRIEAIREKIKKRKAQARKKIKTFDPDNLPFRNRQLKPKAPRLNKEEFQRDLDNNRAATTDEAGHKTAALDAILSFITPSAEAAPPPPTPEDLAENIEIQFTEDILAKAAELDHDPVKIYNWVRNNIEFVPTWGSIQGAQYCLETMQGNAFDTASLLIALLRASNIPARYVMGTVEIPIEQVMNWVGGFTDPQAALDFIASGGIPVKALLEDPNGGINPDQVGAVGGTPVEPNLAEYQIKYAQMEHVWVEAFVDYVPSRGARHKAGQEDTWIELDASFKQYEYTNDMDLQAAVPFDAQSLVDQIISTATINDQEEYVTNVDSQYIQQAIDNYQVSVKDYMAQNYPDANALDILGKREIVEKEFLYLLGTSPYKQFVVGAKYSEIADYLRHKIIFQIKNDNYSLDAGDSINYIVSIPEIAGKKITLSYSPATAQDEAIINSYLPAPHSDGTPIQPDELPISLPAYIVNLKPELRIKGDLVAIGSPIGMGKEEIFKMDYICPTTNDNKGIANEVIAGSFLGIAFNLGRVSKIQMENLYNKLEQAKSKLEAKNISGLTKEDILGNLLYLTALSYLANLEITNQILEKNLEVSCATLPSETIFSYAIKTNDIFGIPMSVSSNGLVMDADRLLSNVKALDGNTAKAKQFMLELGTNSSLLEHIVPERIFSTSNNSVKGISAIKALQIANEQGIPIYTINKSNIAKIIPQLQISQEIINEIHNAINAGKEVTISKTNINFNGWIGCGYIIIDPTTGAGAFMISGGVNGGWIMIATALTLIGFQFIAISSFLTLALIFSPLAVLLISILATLVIGMLFIMSINQTLDSLDSGEITQEDADLVIKARSLLEIISIIVSVENASLKAYKFVMFFYAKLIIQIK